MLCLLFKFKASILFFSMIQFIPSRVESFPMNEKAAACRDFADNNTGLLPYNYNSEYARAYNSCYRGDIFIPQETFLDDLGYVIGTPFRVINDLKYEIYDKWEIKRKEELAAQKAKALAEARRKYIEQAEDNLENIFD